MERVAWEAGWYAQDQPLRVGLEGEFAFWRVVPGHLIGPERHVLYNDLGVQEDFTYMRGKIVGISHPDLGAIADVDTRGLDYTITLADESKFVVNAEEEPGKIFEGRPGAWVESKRIVKQWRFAVDFDSLTEVDSKRGRKD
jgi:hypothetical protein